MAFQISIFGGKVLLLLTHTEGDMLSVLFIHVIQIVGRIVCRLKNALNKVKDGNDLDFANFHRSHRLQLGFSSGLSSVLVPGLDIVAVPFTAEPDRKLVLLLDILLKRVKVIEVLKVECLECLLYSLLAFPLCSGDILISILRLRLLIRLLPLDVLIRRASLAQPY